MSDQDPVPTQTPTEVTVTPINDGTVTSGVSPITLAAAVAASLTLGAFGGVQFGAPTVPAAQVDLFVHVLRLEQQNLQTPPSLTTYSHTVKTLADGGTKLKDVGAHSCSDAGVEPVVLLTALDAQCAPASASASWLHVVELRPATGDGGVVVQAYGSHIGDDGGITDDGLLPCSGVDATAAFVEATSCARSGLDE